MRKNSSVGMLLRFGTSLVTALVFAASSHAGTVTWSGNGDGQSWSDDDNWDPVGQPGSNDDVIHDNDDTILMDVDNSEGSPVIIKSFTCYGSEGGGLVIQTGEHLRVNGHFINNDSEFNDSYELTIESNSTLKLIEATGAADLRYVFVTMEPVTSGDPSKLTVNGKILGPGLSAVENCLVTVGLTGTSPVSVLSGDWALSDGAEAVFDRPFQASDDLALIMTLEGGSHVYVRDSLYSGQTFYRPSGDLQHQLVYGPGENLFEVEPVSSTVMPALGFGNHAVISSLSNTSSLTISAPIIFIDAFFGYTNVREEWDGRGVDVVAAPLDIEQNTFGAGPRTEMISTDFTDWFPSDPVIFLDVPCMGGWRDFIASDAETAETHNHLISDEQNNSYTDNLFGGPGASSVAEVGYFRNVYAGEDRQLIFPSAIISPSGQTRMFYFGTRTIDASAHLYHGGVLNEITGSAIDDFIVPACGTIYGDWNGDCEITTGEITDLATAISEEEYNPLYDRDCDGELALGVERAAILANYVTQPTCDCESSMMAFGGGGSMSEEDYVALAEWIASGLSEPQLAGFLEDLLLAYADFLGTSVGDDMAALLVAFDSILD